jgi:phosphoribosylformylglycinamidine cyclo-ligase/phosphoribosylamine--glycine ligase/phosphoribosylformylglycinamidine cyclo-ligase
MPEDNSVIVERDSMLPRPTIRAGDVLIGFRSSGPHMNGYSLINKVFEGTPLADSLANVLLAPHHRYFHLLYPPLAQCKALAHITGGGFIENIPRVLPENLRALVYLSSWQRPLLWTLIQQKGNISTAEMYRVFNMGVGMVAIVDKSILSDFQKSIAEPTFVLGKLKEGL